MKQTTDIMTDTIISEETVLLTASHAKTQECICKRCATRFIVREYEPGGYGRQSGTATRQLSSCRTALRRQREEKQKEADSAKQRTETEKAHNIFPDVFGTGQLFRKKPFVRTTTMSSISSETALIVLHPLNCQDLLCHALASSLSIPQRQKNRSTFFAFRQGIRDGTQVPVMCISSVNLAGRENNASVGEYFSDFSLSGSNLVIGKNMCSLRVNGMEFFIAVFFIISDNRSFRFADLPCDMYALTDRCFQTFLIFINTVFKCQKTPGVADQPSHPAFQNCIRHAKLRNGLFTFIITQQKE